MVVLIVVQHYVNFNIFFIVGSFTNENKCRNKRTLNVVDIVISLIGEWISFC